MASKNLLVSFIIGAFVLVVGFDDFPADEYLTLRKNQSTFLYFSYGSNMLTERIHINNPTAVQKYIGKIEGHRLDFIGHSKKWHGSVASIVPHRHHEVWGVVWEIDLSDLPNLDRQEGDKYFSKNVTVHADSGKQLMTIRTYQRKKIPESHVKPSLLPPYRQPSSAYLSTIVEGAMEFDLPSCYVQFLKSFKHNGYNGSVDL